ncbi:MAG: SH3 domain-containing protein, partial [Robiginitalea sp.]
MTLDAIAPLPQSDLEKLYRNFLYAFSMDGWAVIGIIFGLLFVLAYLFFLGSRAPNKKRIALISSLVALVLAVSSTLFSFLSYQAYQKDQPAIIYAREIPVRSEPNERSEAIFLLHEGTKVQVRDSLNNWQKIKLADGQ